MCFQILLDPRKTSDIFCSQVKRDPLETECTEDRSSVALCNLVSKTFFEKHTSFLVSNEQILI